MVTLPKVTVGAKSTSPCSPIFVKKLEIRLYPEFLSITHLILNYNASYVFSEIALS